MLQVVYWPMPRYSHENLVTGCRGQVGWELTRSLAALGEVLACDRNAADLSKPDSLRAVVAAARPDIIVNAAAYTMVDKAEEEEALAHVINADAVGVLAEEASRIGALLVITSTEYVFDGANVAPYVESDTPNRSTLTGVASLPASARSRRPAVTGLSCVRRGCMAPAARTFCEPCCGLRRSGKR